MAVVRTPPCETKLASDVIVSILYSFNGSGFTLIELGSVCHIYI